jgi:anti-anti-sigma regulatory factor
MGLLMTATITSRVDRSTFVCGSANVRAQCRHLATVVTIKGGIDASNVGPLCDYTSRFLLAKNNLVLDLSEVELFAPEGISLVNVLAADCHAAGVECMLVASNNVADVLRENRAESLLPVAGSVGEALHYFADSIAVRRQLLLPLIKKTA